MRYFILMFTFVCSFVAAQPTIVPQLQQQVTDLTSSLNSQEKKELTHKLESIFNKEGANKRENSSRLTQSFHFFMFEPIFSPVNALNQPI